ncbi:hypothetical protein A8926_3967 [Saccharopolyspora spinosa]|uniref:Uncharacterized protein n=1 Tax=Saccharopolyspora spinosa TaxID=60894 RepID=A0A2N3XZW2_SACSN|nr:hypothetical protein A8926_3967 [Saccharopolyspora spinosa]
MGAVQLVLGLMCLAVTAFEFPLLGASGPWNLLVEILGISTTIAGGFWLIGVRQANHPRRAGRVSRFAGSNLRQAYFVKAVVVLEGAGIMGLRAFKESSGLLHAAVWSAPVSYLLGSALPASRAAARSSRSSTRRYCGRAPTAGRAWTSARWIWSTSTTSWICAPLPGVDRVELPH